MRKTYNDYRQEIYFLDAQIKAAADNNEKLTLIDKNIALNNEYIAALRKPLKAKKFWCIFLSIICCGLGLIIFLPQIIIRNNKADACVRRVRYLTALKETLSSNK